MGESTKILLMIFIVAQPIADSSRFRNCDLWYGNTYGIFHTSKCKLAGIHSEDIILSEAVSTTKTHGMKVLSYSFATRVW
jgi:hypothetical protein